MDKSMYCIRTSSCLLRVKQTFRLCRLLCNCLSANRVMLTSLLCSYLFGRSTAIDDRRPLRGVVHCGRACRIDACRLAIDETWPRISSPTPRVYQCAHVVEVRKSWSRPRELEIPDANPANSIFASLLMLRIAPLRVSALA